MLKTVNRNDYYCSLSACVGIILKNRSNQGRESLESVRRAQYGAKTRAGRENTNAPRVNHRKNTLGESNYQIPERKIPQF